MRRPNKFADEERPMVPPDTGKSLYLGGVGVIYKIRGEDTGGAYSVMENRLDPGRLIPAHMHTREDELSYVLEGQLGFRIGDREFTADPGTYVLVPRNVPHTFWNATTKPARLMAIISPAGFEQYFEELAELYELGGPPDPERYLRLR